MRTIRDHLTGSYGCLFLSVFVLFISDQIVVAVVAKGKSQSASKIRLRDLCVRWSFLGGVFFREGARFFNVVRSPLPNYQIVDLESFLI